MPEPGYELYVGVDWATETHQVCLLSPDGQRLGELAVPHTGRGWRRCAPRWASG